MQIFDTAEWDRLFSNLLFDIQTRSCVLLIGPEIIQVENRSSQEHLSELLERQHQGDIERYYTREGLFLFKNPASKNEVQRTVSQFYHTIRPDTTVFKAISEIPFPLIISVNPDDLLSRSFGGTAHFTACFNHHAGSNGQEETGDWDGQTPLIYNLFGTFVEDASVILDHDDLYNFLKTVLGPVGLPDNVRSRLRRAKSFLFVGFQFDKWYTQLLLRLLNEGNSPTQIALHTRLGDHDARHFLFKRYNMKFLGRVLGDDPEGEPAAGVTSLEFLSELNRRWKAAKAPVGADQEPVSQNSIRRLVERGDLDTALKTLPDLFSDPEDLDMVTTLSNWHANWKREVARGAEDSRTLENRYNKVLNGILEQLKTLSA